MKVTFEHWEAAGKVASEDGMKDNFGGGDGGFIRLNPTESDCSIFQHEPHVGGLAKKTANSSDKQRITNQSALNRPIPPKQAPSGWHLHSLSRVRTSVTIFVVCMAVWF